MNKKPLVLVILDGYGIRKEKYGNAIAQAKTPNLDRMLKKYPNSKLKASGKYVGLPEGQIGNSEVGHLNLGAGQIVHTGLSLINKAIGNNHFEENEVFLETFEYVKKKNKTLHLMGLLSDGGVHGHENHLFKLLEMAHKNGVEKVSVHAIADGRDVKPFSIKESLKKLLPLLKKYNYELASLGGRLYAMDRDSNFEKVELAYEAMQGNISNKFSDVYAYIDDQYKKIKSDEFIDVAINENAKNFLSKKDAVILFNFRPDRMREISHLLVGSKLYKYKPQKPVKKIHLVTMMKYEGIDKCLVAFKPRLIIDTLGTVISTNNMSQVRIAETQKYSHVTYFFDGGREIELKKENRILIPSLKEDDFSKVPNMSAKGITNSVISHLENFDVLIVNYANADMVGHTGDLNATIKAVECLDKQIGELDEAVNKAKGVMFITADHGNAEITEDSNGKPATKHTTNEVMFICSDTSIKLKDGVLSNVGPTILDYLNLPKPLTMTQESLIKK